jgi:hypothetical protein
MRRRYNFCCMVFNYKSRPYPPANYNFTSMTGYSLIDAGLAI